MMKITYLLSLILIFNKLEYSCVYCGGPLKIYAKGYTKRTLSTTGGWTRWFNTHFGHGLGDHERIYDILRMYGRNCRGLPCRKPLAMKIISTNWLSPNEEGNDLLAHPRYGMECYNHHQYRGKKCVDYMVRFFCPDMSLKCRKWKKKGQLRKLKKFLWQNSITKTNKSRN